LLYYSQSLREMLLDKALSLSYSQRMIDKLRSYSNEQWNADCIDSGVIEDFEALEQYVNDNSPNWERNPLAKIGKFFNQDGTG